MSKAASEARTLRSRQAELEDEIGRLDRDQPAGEIYGPIEIVKVGVVSDPGVTPPVLGIQAQAVQMIGPFALGSDVTFRKVGPVLRAINLGNGTPPDPSSDPDSGVVLRTLGLAKDGVVYFRYDVS